MVSPFSSLFREFISLICSNLTRTTNISQLVFVPFQGIHFFNLKLKPKKMKWSKKVFVPFQGIHFFNQKKYLRTASILRTVFVPFQGIHFFNPDLSTSMFMRLKTSFCGANLIFLFLISFHSTKQVSIPHK